jgi:membrane protein
MAGPEHDRGARAGVQRGGSSSIRREAALRSGGLRLRWLLRPPVPWKRFLRDLWQEAERDHLTTGAAALAYFLMLSIFPAAIFLLSLLPYLPIAHLEQAIMDLLREVMPVEAAELFTTTVQRVVSERRGGLLSFGLLAAVWTAATGLYAVMEQLNVTYGVEDSRPFWKKRGIALLLVLLFGLLVIGAFGLIVFGGVLQAQLAQVLGWSTALLAFFATLRWVIILAMLLLGLAVAYYFGPDVQQNFRIISPGSIVGVVVLLLAALGFRFYVDHFASYEATYGSLGAVIILLLWLYVTGLAILVGSEINALFEHYAEAIKQRGAGVS